MEGQFLQDLVNRLPTGYIYYELIHNNEPTAEDFVILDANRAAEEMTGFIGNSFTGRKAIDIFAEIKSVDFDWNVFFSDAAGSCVGWEKNFCADIRGNRYKVTAYFPNDRHLVTIFEKTEPDDGASRLFETVFNEHAAFMLLTEPFTHRIVDANPAACAFCGYTKEEFLTMRIGDLSPQFMKEMESRSLLSPQDSMYFLFPYRLKNGEIRMVDIYCSPVPYRNKTYYFSIIFDVTERENYKEELFRQKELLRITFESVDDGVVTTDQDGRVTFLNKSAQEITGWRDDEARSKDFTDVFVLKNEETGKTTEDPVGKALKTGQTVGLANHTVLMDKQNRPVPVADSASPIRDENGNIFGVVMVFRDVSRDRAQQAHIMDLSCHDSLTGLYNRMFLSENLHFLDTAENLPLSVIIGDVNGLKLTNDAFGHEEGDRLLKKVADSFRVSCRKEDYIIRWGGDEFLVLLPRTPEEKAKDVFLRMQGAFFRNSKGPLQISVSLGYAVKSSVEENYWDVFKEAEKWMYHRKLLEGKSHRNNIISTLLATLYENNSEAEEHSRRLEIYCRAIGKKMRLSSDEKNELSLLAMLHDIGMVGIRQDSIRKEGPLTSVERDEIRRHPEIGYRIAQNTPELSSVSEYILLHHERWDGKGYPKGYKGEQIPLLCRILAVAGAYDVFTAPSSYKKALSRDEAVAELERGAGKEFDPRIVGIFSEIIRKKELPDITGSGLCGMGEKRTV
jgi:diguanylate cyclase (GGDEF)-like protein/PAS domain S-box-containing protein